MFLRVSLFIIYLFRKRERESARVGRVAEGERKAQAHPMWLRTEAEAGLDLTTPRS